MVFGMSLATYTLIHVVISLVGIGSGLIVLFGMFGGKRLDGMTALFLATTALTSLTGFGFPFEHLTPGIILGILSVVVLAIAVPARYSFRMAGKWRAIYVVTAVIALYFNCFVLIAQSFMKVPALHALAPKGNEPPFAIAQGILLVLFIVAGTLAVRKFRLGATVSAARAA
ncbi:MAG TPA: hypothetical protein VE176_09200 [Candidatus Limnocylindrales bacterium]|jgi:hypothetical protein|nr:hypothetical protein [Candidatus Limnocylindrales bacterium]